MSAESIGDDYANIGSSIAHYIATGKRLRNDADSGMKEIEEGITQYIADSAKRSFIDSLFAYLYGSSGLGKTQLAFALQRRVLYIPLGEVFHYVAVKILFLRRFLAFFRHVSASSPRVRVYSRRDYDCG